MTRVGSGFCVRGRAVPVQHEHRAQQLQTNRDFDGQPPRLAGVGRVAVIPSPGSRCHMIPARDVSEQDQEAAASVLARPVTYLRLRR